jgi:hypothetical protein
LKFKLVFTAILFAAVLSSSQAQTAPVAPAPQLSTADKIALQTLESAKAKDQEDFGEKVKAEQAIFNEFANAHPGWHINPQSGAVEHDAPAAKTPEVKK